MDHGSKNKFEQNQKFWDARSFDKTPEVYRPKPCPPCHVSDRLIDASYKSYFEEERNAMPFVPTRDIWKVLADILVTARNLEALNENRMERDERLMVELLSLTSDLEAIEAKLTPEETRPEPGDKTDAITKTSPFRWFWKQTKILQFLWNIVINSLRWNRMVDDRRWNNPREGDYYTGNEAEPSEPIAGTSGTQSTVTSSKGFPHQVKRSRPNTTLPLLEKLMVRIFSIVFCLALLMPICQWMYQWFMADRNWIETSYCEIWTGNHVIWEHHSLNSCFTGRVKYREGPY